MNRRSEATMMIVMRREHQAEATRLQALLQGGPDRLTDRLQPIPKKFTLQMIKELRRRPS